MYNVWHSFCKFRGYYFAIFRQPTPKHTKHKCILVLIVQNVTGDGYYYVHKYNIMFVKE